MSEEQKARLVYEKIPQFGRLRESVLFGDVWQQPEITLRDRSLITCSILAATGKRDELESHMRRALQNGVTEEELRGLVVQVAFYAGWPAGLMTGKALLTVAEANG